MISTFDEVQTAHDQLIQYRNIAGKHIIIVEAPSGAGKTTLCNRLAELQGVDLVSRSLGKREFQIYEAGAKSFMNDHIKMMEALLSKESVVFIDRCVASQKVYHSIRSDRPVSVNPPTWQIPQIALETLEQDLHWRIGRKVRKINVYWLFLIPDAKALEARRKTGGKEYPNRVSDEILMYKQVSNQIMMDGKEILRPAYNDMADQDFIVRGFESWLEHWPYIDFPTLWRCFATLTQAKGEDKNG